MRIVLKPGGFALLVVALLILTYVALFSGKPTNKPVAASTKIAEKTAAPVDTTPMLGPNLAINGDFEGEFIVTKPDNPSPLGKINGKSADGWQDSSGWAQIDVQYAPETKDVHGGKYCQKITVTNKKTGQAQLVKYIDPRPGKQVRATAWVRTEGENNVLMVIRDSQDFEHNYIQVEAPTGNEWQKVEATATVTGKNNIALLLAVQNNGTVWIDDVTFEVLP